MDKWTLKISLYNQQGERFDRAIELDLDCIRSGMNPRLRDEMEFFRSVGSSALSFGQTVDLLKKREFRRSVFLSEAKRLGGVIADYLEDAEGWHGLDRAERIKDGPI